MVELFAKIISGENLLTIFAYPASDYMLAKLAIETLEQGVKYARSYIMI